MISGGKTYYDYFKSVEAYDHHKNRWEILPNMIERRKNYSSVGIGNKLFVIRVNYRMSSEVFNSTSRKFRMFNLELPHTYSFNKIKMVSFNSKIVVCVCSTYNPSKLHIYNVDESKWIQKGITVKYNYDEADFQIAPKQ